MDGYTASALIPPTKPADLNLVAKEVKQIFANTPDVIVEQEAKKITVQLSSWSLRIWLNDYPSVLVESKDIARIFGKGRPDIEVIASCDRRFDVASDFDPNMKYFNEYLWVVEAIQRTHDVLVIDMINGYWM